MKSIIRIGSPILVILILMSAGFALLGSPMFYGFSLVAWETWAFYATQWIVCLCLPLALYDETGDNPSTQESSSLSKETLIRSLPAQAIIAALCIFLLINIMGFFDTQKPFTYQPLPLAIGITLTGMVAVWNSIRIVRPSLKSSSATGEEKTS